MVGFHRLLSLDPADSVQIETSPWPSPSEMVIQAGYGDALQRHLDAWTRKVQEGRATNGTAVALRSIELERNGGLILRFIPHTYVQHRSIRDLCAEVRPRVDPNVVSPVWNSGCPLFLVVRDAEGAVIATQHSATVAVAPNRVSLAFTEGGAIEDLVPRWPVAMVQRCLAEELGLHATIETIAPMMAHTAVVLDGAQNQWGIFSVVDLRRCPMSIAPTVAPDAWETAKTLRVPFTPDDLRAFATAHHDRFAPGGMDLAQMLIGLADENGAIDG